MQNPITMKLSFRSNADQSICDGITARIRPIIRAIDLVTNLINNFVSATGTRHPTRTEKLNIGSGLGPEILEIK